MKKNICLILVFLLLATFITGCSKTPEETPPLACLSLVTNDDSFALEIARAFKDSLIPLGYRTQVVFCDNNIETQRIQIANFIANDADLILVHSAGNTKDYEDLFEKAQISGCKVIAMGREKLDYCDVQSMGYSFLKGVAKCELVKEFLDEEYPDAPPGTVTVLVLENLAKTAFIMTSAGMRLLEEKYLRYFDYNSLEFAREQIGETVYYLDEKEQKAPVDEPAGGLILDEDGYAILNPCYDARVNLELAPNKDILTVLDGQKAIESFISVPNGSELKIVISFSGDAAIGANQKIMQYYETGILPSELNKFAVFGSDDTETNRNLIFKSAENESVYRGFVGYRSVYWEITTMIEMVFDEHDDNLLELDVVKGRLSQTGDSVELEHEHYSFWNSYDIFAGWD